MEDSAYGVDSIEAYKKQAWGGRGIPYHRERLCNVVDTVTPCDAAELHCITLIPLRVH